MKIKIIVEFPTIENPRIDISHAFLWYGTHPFTPPPRGALGWIELLLFKLPKHDSNWYGTRTLLTKNEPPRPKKSIRDR